MKNEQRVVWAIRDRTFLMIGDPGQKTYDGDALPKLLAEGWRIQSVHQFAEKGSNDLTPVAYFILEKGMF
jgi:hypothetical protein